jgi:hypothetical protein
MTSHDDTNQSFPQCRGGFPSSVACGLITSILLAGCGGGAQPPGASSGGAGGNGDSGGAANGGAANGGAANGGAAPAGGTGGEGAAGGNGGGGPMGGGDGGRQDMPIEGVASIWAVHDGEKIEQDELDSPYEAGNTAWDGQTIKLFGARNEVIAFQLVVETDGLGVSGLDVALPALKQAGGDAAITYAPPGDDPTAYAGRPISLFTEHYMHVEETSDAAWRFDPASPAAPADPTGWKPVQLVPENATPGKGGLPIDVAPGQSQAFWIEVYTARDLPAGVYLGEVKVSAGGAQRTVPVELTLFDFTLPDEGSMSAMLYFEKEQLDLYIGEDVADRFHRFGHRHRVELVNEYSTASLGAALGRFDGSDFGAGAGYDGPGKDVGNRIIPASFYGPNPEYQQESSAQDASDAWINYLKNNVPGAITFLYMPDEPGSGQYGEIHEMASFIHDNPGPGQALPIFVTSKYKGGLDGAIDIWCAPAQSYDIQVAEAQRAQGHDYWFYNGHRPHTGSLVIDSPATDARANAWIAFKHGVDVYFYWHSNHWEHNFQKVGDKQQDVWANPVTFDNRGQPNKPLADQGFANGDGVLVYPGKEILHPEQDRGIEGPISTIQLASLRRGLQDHLYLTMARDLGLSDAVTTALSGVVPAVLSDAGQSVGFSEHGDDYEAARRKLAEAITAAR